MATFREVFCRRFDCSGAEFEQRVFKAVAYPHVRLLAAIGLHRSDHFAPDRALITYCGILHSPRQMAAELRDFATLPENRRFSRRVLLFRVSGRRLQRLIHECIGAATRAGNDASRDSRTPFAGERKRAA